MPKSKIHRARLTGVRLDYKGSTGCGGGMASAEILGGLAAAALWFPRRVVRIFRWRTALKEGSAE